MRSGKEKVDGYVSVDPFSKLVYTGSYVTFFENIFSKNTEKIHQTSSCYFYDWRLTEENYEMQGKLDTVIKFSSRTLEHKVYILGTTDQCNLGLNFLQNFNVTIDLKNAI